jgi:hypothetical protein
VESLGLVLLRVLEFFGCGFDFEAWGLTVRGGGAAFPLQAPPPGALPPAVLTVEDPLFPGRNAAASSAAFPLVVAACEHAFHALAAFRPSSARPTPLSQLLHPNGFARVDAELGAVAAGDAAAGAAVATVPFPAALPAPSLAMTTTMTTTTATSERASE